MTILSTPITPTGWQEPEGVAARGTVIVLPGRGETAATYGRLGRRLAADAYRVRVLPHTGPANPVVAERLRRLLADPALPSPRVLLGSDTGALTALRLAAGVSGIQAVVVAGTPDSSTPAITTWQEELDARTSCPTHRRVLADDAGFRRGALTDPAPAEAAVDLSSATSAGLPPDLPILVLHGGADPVSSVTAVRTALAGAGRLRVAVVEGAHHDVLNDVSHRSVAATLVLFLESLRLDPSLPVIVHGPDDRPDSDDRPGAEER